jgi:hypothetical protein
MLTELDIQKTVTQLRDWVNSLTDGKADTAMFWAGSKAITPRDILIAVEERTDFGLQYVESLIDLQKNENPVYNLEKPE